MSYNIIALDLDGTLTNSEKEISKPTLEGLIDIQKRGKKVVLASGRPTPGITMLADQLHMDAFGSYILSYNGAKIIDCKTKEIIYQRTMPNHVMGDLLAHAKKAGVGLVTYENDGVVAGTRKDKYMEIEARINKIEIKEVCNFAEYVTFPVNKCLMTGEHKALEQVREKLKKKYKSELDVYFSERYFLEIMPKGTDKASSLAVLLEKLGMTREELICCGDGGNDISMIKYAGLGVAMENAQEEVKEVADYITLSNDNDGVLKVIKKFMKD